MFSCCGVIAPSRCATVVVQRGVRLVLLVVMVMMMLGHDGRFYGRYLESAKPLYIIGIVCNSGCPMAG
jgi:hypothetical protein